jgi:hypothetical protein
MRSACLKVILIALAVLAAPAASYAADATPIRIVRAPAVAPAVEDTIIIEQASPVLPAPVVRYGCKRIWRCDSVVCDWRRGCWGTYGYMEGPYYTVDLAKRQWERHGWPMPERRSSVNLPAQPSASLK